MVGGDDVARAVLRGERKLVVGPGPTVEDIIRQMPSSLPPLYGKVVKGLNLKPNKVKSVKDTIKFGGYNGVDGDIVELFAEDDFRLTKMATVDLVQFDRNPSYDEILAWAKKNGEKKPILPKHIFALGIQHPDEQRNAPIVALGSVRHGLVLCLDGYSTWRVLRRSSVQSSWLRHCLFGFLS